MGILDRVVNNERRDSVAHRFRRQRFDLFLSLLETIERPIRILDVGGTVEFWKRMDFPGANGVEIVIFNSDQAVIARAGFTAIKGDARRMPFAAGEFSVVFSNSTIEHVGTLADQRAVAEEIRRVGQSYFVQTPYRHFPLEAHALLPLFQYLPPRGRAWIAGRFKPGWYQRMEASEAAEGAARVRLLSPAELKRLFPTGKLYEEKVFGLTKSLVVYGPS